MIAENTTTTGFIVPLLHTLEDYGIDIAWICLEAGIDQTLLDDNNHRIPVSSMRKLWALAAHTSGTDAIGLEAATNAVETLVHPYLMAVQTSESILEVLERMKKYSTYVSNGVTVDYRVEEAIDIVLQESDSDANNGPSKYGIDMFFGVLASEAKRISGPRNLPVKVEFKRKPPRASKQFQQYFGCPIYYQTPQNRIIFPLVDLNKPLPNSNPELIQHLDAFLQGHIEELNSNDFLKAVHQYVMGEISQHDPMGIPKIDEVAHHFSMSSRSFQRRLSEHDSHYKAVIDAARFELAKHYLQQAHYSIGEMSYSLGFSTESNFIRAFKRWSGETPNQFRKNLSKD